MPTPEELDTSSFSSARMASDVLSAVAVFEQRLYNAFLRFVKSITDDVALMSLLDDIQNGVFIAMTPGVEERLAQVNIPARDLARIQRQALARAAKATAKNVGMSGRLDLTSPSAIDKARKITADMVRYVTEETKAALRELVGQVVAGDMTKAAAKRLIAQRVGLLPQHANAVDKYYARLIQTFDRDRAQEMAGKYAQRLLEYRAENIARTEISRAMSWGQMEVWEQMQAQGLLPSNVTRTWIVSFDERLCKLCEPMHTITASIDGVWETPTGPVRVPTDIHPQCRCTSGLVFLDEVGKADPVGWEHWQLAKHAPGQHDQSSHGSWAEGLHPNIRSIRTRGPGDTQTQLGLDEPQEAERKPKSGWQPAFKEPTPTHGRIANLVTNQAEITYGQLDDLANQHTENIAKRMREMKVTDKNVEAFMKLFSAPEFKKLFISFSNHHEVRESNVNANIESFLFIARESWNNNTNNPLASLMKMAAVEVLGASRELSGDRLVNDRNKKLWDALVKNKAAYALVKAAVQAQYDETQSVLKKLGITHVILARGVAQPVADELKKPSKPRQVNLKHDSLSSFTDDINITTFFGSRLIVNRVPASNIYSIADLGGLGVTDEREFVVINRPDSKSYVFNNAVQPNGERHFTAAEIAQKVAELFANVKKHYEHDQRSHGNWARYRADSYEPRVRGLASVASPARARADKKPPANLYQLEEEAINKMNGLADRLYGSATGEFTDAEGKKQRWSVKLGEVDSRANWIVSEGYLTAVTRITGAIVSEKGQRLGTFKRFIRFNKRDKYVMHESLFMEPEYLGRGIGGSFVKQSIKAAKEAGLEKVYVDAIMSPYYAGGDGEANGTLIWAKLGFKLDDYYGPAGFKTSKQLVSAYEKELAELERRQELTGKSKKQIVVDYQFEFPLLASGSGARYSLNLTKPLPESLSKADEWNLDSWDDILAEWVEEPLDDSKTLGTSTVAK